MNIIMQYWGRGGFKMNFHLETIGQTCSTYYLSPLGDLNGVVVLFFAARSCDGVAKLLDPRKRHLNSFEFCSLLLQKTLCNHVLHLLIVHECVYALIKG